MTSSFRADPPKPINFQAEDDRLFVRSAAKAMQVLSAFHHASGPLSLSEIASRAGIDRSAAQRLVHTLMTLGGTSKNCPDPGAAVSLRR